MRLTTTDDREPLPNAVGACLDRRLLPTSPHPVAVALSGGGDSLALLLCADAWRKRTSRDLIVLTLDHGLRSESAQWARDCAGVAERLGLPFRGLRWEGARPATGLPAAAREARHRLLARAARAAGARVLLMGHTADDLAETQAMRAAGSTTPDVREWGPSPAWPDGRGLFLLRPMLSLRRDEIRSWLTARGERWIDDPANDDERFARARARRQPTGEPADAAERPPLSLAAEVREPAPGMLVVPRAALRNASDVGALRLLALMAVCAGGGARIPATDSLGRALLAFRGVSDAMVTLAGARLQSVGEMLWAVREAGEAKRGGLEPVTLAPGEPTVWDGRFEVEAIRPGLELHALTGRMARLPEAQRSALNAIPAFARPSLPALVDSEGVSCPLVALRRDVVLRPLVMERLGAAAGLVMREPA